MALRLPRALATLTVASILPGTAAANGAFPDSMAIFAPSDGRVLLGTNFGLLTTDDLGDTPWRWICEAAIAPFPYLYQVGPSGAVHAVDLSGLFTSTDGCSWVKGAAPSSPDVADAFADPTDPARLYLLGRPTTTSTGSYGLFVSDDGGRTFGDAVYLTEPGAVLDSVEVARSSPAIVYLTKSVPRATAGRAAGRFILRSSDRGRTFEARDVSSDVGTRLPRIAAVDPSDPDTLYLRLGRTSPRDGEALGISRDGGRTVEVALPLDAKMTAFLRRASGELVVASAAGTFRSSDGRRFAPWAGAPHVRALAERDGVVFAATDDVVDGFGAATTSDGVSWTPILHFREIGGPLDCPAVRAACDPRWPDLVLRLMITPPDAGVRADAASPSIEPTSADGACRCTAHGEGGRGIEGWGLVVLLLARRRAGARRG